MMRVFLGGTCNESKWRTVASERLTRLGIDFFNPVVDDWNDAAREREITERETCDFCLYVITPLMTGVYSIAEAVDDSNKRPSQTVFVRMRQDGHERFDDGQWRSLGAVCDLVKRNGAQAFDSMIAAVEWIHCEAQRVRDE